MSVSTKTKTKKVEPTVPMKVKDLTGKYLDWAVDLCRGGGEPWYPDPTEGYGSGPVYVVKAYSTDPAFGHPVLEQEHISVFLTSSPVLSADKYKWQACPRQPEGERASGPTMLIAGLRCYVLSIHGEEIQVPRGLA
jgi:hypothetical protein